MKKVPSFFPEVVEEFRTGKYKDSGIIVVDSDKAAKKLLNIIWNRKDVYGLDSEFDSTAERGENPIQVFSLAWEGGCAVIHVDFMHHFKEWLEHVEIKKTLQNFSADEEVFFAAGIQLRGLCGDTMVMDFLADTSDRKHGLKHAILKWRKYKMMGMFKEVFSYVPKGKKKPIVYTWAEIWADPELQIKLILYSADDPVQTRWLFRRHKRWLEKTKYWDTYKAEDLPFTITLSRTQRRGMQIDKPGLSDIQTVILIEMLRATHVFRALINQSGLDVKPYFPKSDKTGLFNLASNPQLNGLFFDLLDMPQLKQTQGEKKNEAETATCKDGSVLEQWMLMKKDYPLGAQLAEVLRGYRQDKTLQGTFVTGILNGLEPVDDKGQPMLSYNALEEQLKESLGQPTTKVGWRLYSDLNQIGAVTGRISSRKYSEEVEETFEKADGEEGTRLVKLKKGANLQNIPTERKDDYGIRRKFIALPGHVLVVVDEAGFEWWLMAHWSKDELMMRQSHEGLDPHGITGAASFGLPTKIEDWKIGAPGYEELKAKYKTERNIGKTKNFASLYGAQAKKIMLLLGLETEEEGQEHIDSFFDLYPGIVDYHNEQVMMAQELGYVKTISGRRVYIEDINEEHPGKRAHAENQAKNAPIQGSAGDIIKNCMNILEFGSKLYKKCSRIWFPAGAGISNKKIMLVKEACERADRIRALHPRKEAMTVIQVHDEIVQEVPEKHAQEVLEHTVFIMENHRYMPIMVVRTPAEGKYGPNWAAAK